MASAAATTPTPCAPTPDARLARKGKGKEATLSYLANTLMENRNGLIVGVGVRHACGRGEREGALALIDARGLRPGSRCASGC